MLWFKLSMSLGSNMDRFSVAFIDLKITRIRLVFFPFKDHSCVSSELFVFWPSKGRDLLILNILVEMPNHLRGTLDNGIKFLNRSPVFHYIIGVRGCCTHPKALGLNNSVIEQISFVSCIWTWERIVFSFWFQVELLLFLNQGKQRRWQLKS